jgi:hypothetical protein
VRQCGLDKARRGVVRAVINTVRHSELSHIWTADKDSAPTWQRTHLHVRLLKHKIISLFILTNKRNNTKEYTASYQHNHSIARPSSEAHDWCNNSSWAVKKQVIAGAICRQKNSSYEVGNRVSYVKTTAYFQYLRTLLIAIGQTNCCLQSAAAPHQAERYDDCCCVRHWHSQHADFCSEVYEHSLHIKVGTHL